MTKKNMGQHFASRGETKGDLYLEYSFVFLLALNVFMLVYLAFKLYRFYARKPYSTFERKNRRYRTFIFLLIFFALILRGVFEMAQILGLSQIVSDTVVSIGILCDDLSTLLLVSVACAFSYFWYEIYSSFEEVQASTSRPGWSLKFVLIFINVALYLAFAGLATIYLKYQWSYTFLVLHCVFILSLIFSTVMLKIHGSNLYYKALALVSYTGKNVRSSSGFRMIYIVLIICCMIRCLKEALAIYLSFSFGDNLLKDLADADDGSYLALIILYIAFFFVFGEYGLFLSLIMLLDFYADKAKVSFSSEIDTTRGQTFALMQDSPEGE